MSVLVNVVIFNFAKKSFLVFERFPPLSNLETFLEFQSGRFRGIMRARASPRTRDSTDINVGPLFLWHGHNGHAVRGHPYRPAANVLRITMATYLLSL